MASHNAKPKTRRLLEPIGSTIVELSPGTFPDGDRSKVGDNVPIEISYCRDGFCEWMLGLERQPPVKKKIRWFRLLRESNYDLIISKLGGEQKAETAPSIILELVRRQKSGKTGVLLVNKFENVFFVRDTKNVLRSVYIFRCDKKWIMCCGRTEYPGRCSAKRRVFSSN